nr:hypothetical protein [Desulfuromonadales bacterium]
GYRDFFQGRLADIRHARRQAMWTAAVWTLTGIFAGASFGYAALGGFGAVGETAGEFLMAGALLSAGGCIVLGLRPLRKVHRRIKELVVGGICGRL